MKATFETSVVPLKFYVDLLMEKVKDQQNKENIGLKFLKKSFTVQSMSCEHN